MHRGYRLISSLILTAALVAPVGLMAAARPEDDRNQEHRDSDNRDNKRYYDKQHHEYHTWNNNEDGAYQRFQKENHEKRAFVDLNTQRQGAYWNWRHEHPDNR
jgi:Ni/Co efflux regulator RcnB